MSQPLDDQAQTRMEIAALAVAFARTLGEQDDTFLPRFDKQMERVYRQLEDASEPLGAMELLRWAHELIDL